METISSDGEPTIPARRRFLRRVLLETAGVMGSTLLSACATVSSTAESRIDDVTATPPVQPTTRASGTVRPTALPSIAAQPTTVPSMPPASTSGRGSRTLVAYFSRAGENYANGGRTILTVGNTEVLAGLISQRIACEVYRIEPVEPYSDDYDETVARNVQEQEANARPAIATPLASIEAYDTVLLGSPIWNVRAPMIMSTFVEGFAFSGKTVIPVVTYAVSGLGTTVRDYTAACPGATIGEGLAVRGEEVQDAGAAVEAWLRRINLLS